MEFILAKERSASSKSAAARSSLAGPLLIMGIASAEATAMTIMTVRSSTREKARNDVVLEYIYL